MTTTAILRNSLYRSTPEPREWGTISGNVNDVLCLSEVKKVRKQKKSSLWGSIQYCGEHFVDRIYLY